MMRNPSGKSSIIICEKNNLRSGNDEQDDGQHLNKMIKGNMKGAENMKEENY